MEQLIEQDYETYEALFTTVENEETLEVKVYLAASIRTSHLFSASLTESIGIVAGGMHE